MCVLLFLDSESLVVVVRPSISVPRGHTTTLPCWLNPQQSAEGLEVRWYRPNHFDSPVLLYIAKKFENAAQEASFRGRVSFGLMDVQSGGLKAGDVSLKLTNVTLEDAGEYTCYVSSDQVYDSRSVSLEVTRKYQDHMVNVSCESEGWYPEPSLRWSDPKPAQSSKNTKHSKDSSGLLSVHSWILVSSSTEVSCSVGPLVPRKSGQECPGSSHGGWIAFVLLLLIVMLALLGLYFYKKRECRGKIPRVYHHFFFNMILSNFKYIFILTANVTLKRWKIHTSSQGCRVRDADCQGITGGTCHTAIRGTPGFSSGLHYWEVSMGNDKIGLKEADRFQFSTKPNVLLPVRSRPQTVGVYLNHDIGELSFYNAQDKSLIGSFKANFTGEVFPLFNPGVGDRAPMTILQREKHNENNDVQDPTQTPTMTSVKTCLCTYIVHQVSCF
uniref:Ig-like domain-containing protein n=1 Tax=Labrus bergylta TaxID=56723 RepID=A0A3Q3H123_9LABR